MQEVDSLKKQREKYEKELESLRHDLERAEGAKSKCLYETEKVQVDMEKVRGRSSRWTLRRRRSKWTWRR
jgi:uncharacterized protein (DUF3084 family)